MNNIVIILIAVIVVLAIIVICLYNKLVNFRNLADEAWSNVDVFLTKRHDLIPQVVNTVKGYADHEKALLETVTLLRSQAVAANTPGQQLALEDQLTKALGEIKISVEKYPELKANENFLALQRQLSQMETEIERSRRYFNGCVRNLNNAVETFPNNLIAGMFGFSRKKFYEVEDAGNRQAPTVSLS